MSGTQNQNGLIASFLSMIGASDRSPLDGQPMFVPQSVRSSQGLETLPMPRSFGSAERKSPKQLEREQRQREMMQRSQRSWDEILRKQEEKRAARRKK
jgi:hypothetical protein